jgi:hypothetical protein
MHGNDCAMFLLQEWDAEHSSEIECKRKQLDHFVLKQKTNTAFQHLNGLNFILCDAYAPLFSCHFTMGRPAAAGRAAVSGARGPLRRMSASHHAPNKIEEL